MLFIVKLEKLAHSSHSVDEPTFVLLALFSNQRSLMHSTDTRASTMVNWVRTIGLSWFSMLEAASSTTIIKRELGLNSIGGRKLQRTQ